MDQLKKILFTLLGITLLILSFIIFYIIMPPISFKFFSFWIALLLLSIIIGGLLIRRRKWLGIGLPVLVGFSIVGMLISSSGIIKSEEKRALIGEVQKKQFTEDISPIDITKVPIVDHALAENLGDKKLGEEVALGSQVTLSEFTQINVGGELFWVAPLEHSGFFKWYSNRDGTPGYIKISATNPQNIELVREVNGKKINIKYQPNAYFGDDLKRKIYTSGYNTIGLTDYSFELDDQGNPYWVVTKYKNTIGISGSEAIGVIVLDPQTGEIEDYSIENSPEWIDRIIPSEFVLNQLNDWGRYVHGWWNPSKKDRIQTTYGSNIIYNEGDCYYYTGMTSAGSDEATVGFILVNTRNKDVNFYRVSGSHEIAAMESAEGKVQNLGYTATFPILLNIENQPTYFTTMKDKKGLVKLYAMINVKDYSLVGTGETLGKTKSNYMKYLRNAGNLQGLKKSGDEIIKEVTIKRIGYTVIDDTTYYYMVVKENTEPINKIFIAALNMSNELPLTKEGDRVRIKYYANENKTIDIIAFDNLEILND